MSIDKYEDCGDPMCNGHYGISMTLDQLVERVITLADEKSAGYEMKIENAIVQHHQDMMREVVKRADMEIYALENTLEKSKELSVAIGHKRVYERVKLIGEYKGKLEAWREIKEMLTEAKTIIKSK